MAADLNPQSGGTIDLRTMQGGTSGQSATGTTQGAAQGVVIPEKFQIPETVRTKYADLIPLILETESMNDDERQYWFQILPIMTEEQVKKLREILDNEKNQLAKLDDEYQQELKKINDKHTAEWKAFEAEEKRKKLQAAESSTKESEEAKQEELLQNLQQL